MTKTSVFYCLQYFTIFTLLLNAPNSKAAANKIPDFETTRLKSTGGAGVASILMDEATILNPAPLTFFQNGSFYFQKSNSQINRTPNDLNQNAPITQKNDQLSFIASDAKGNLNGSISYIKQEHRYSERKRFSASLAYPTGKKSSFGIAYRHTKEALSTDNINFKNSTYKQTTFGVIHALNSSFTIGMVVIDPFKKRPEETRSLIGIQYVYQDFISLMLDGGADYSDKLDKTALWKAAVQIKLLQDFYLRTGAFEDQGKREKGTGIGLGWIQPRLVINFALKNTDVLENKENFQNPEEIKETSFSLSYRF